jgi:predicted DsbA family dithiol-disulfide isomerase
MLVLLSLLLLQAPGVLATVNGENITEAQVLKAAGADVTKLTGRARLEAMWRALDSIIEDKLLTAEAAKMSMTKERLLEIEVDSNVDTPSPAEVEAFYEANRAQIPVPRAQALPQVRQYMIDQSRRRYRDNLMRNLRRNHSVVTYLDPLRTEVPTAGFPSRGPANAAVTIVKFSDFECPFCGATHPVLKAVEKNYPTQVRLVYRQFPLTNIHPRAQKASEASLCANEQGRFWEYHDSLFANQGDLEVPALKRRAAELKLNTATFNTCLDSGRMADAVKKEADEGRKLGVASTPTLFVNGRMLTGGQTYNDIRAVIEDELKRRK